MRINEVNLRWNGSLRYCNSPKRIVLHHAEASRCSVQDIHQWHLDNGWVGIGYHYLVRKDGSVWRGRPEGAQGAHCPGANTNSIGICFEGSYMTETMESTQFNAGMELIGDVRRRYGNLSIFGHRELYSTDCPGTNFPLNDFRNGHSSSSGSSSGSSSSQLPSGTKAIIVSTSSLNVRSGPSTDYEKIGSVFENEEVTIEKRQGTWGYIAYHTSNGIKRGWASTNYMKIIGGSSSSSRKGTVTIGRLNVRTGPGTNYDIKGAVFNGESVDILSSKNGWYQIRYDTSNGKKEGYVSANYIK